MIPRTVDVVELEGGDCQIVVVAQGVAVVVELNPAEAERVARQLLDGGRVPAGAS